MSRKDLLPSIVMAGVLLAATALCLGAPDMALVNQFFIVGDTTVTAAIAVVSLLCWIVIGIIALAVIIVTGRATKNDAQQTLHRWTRAVMLVLAGVMVLGMGTVRHVNNGYSMCSDCGVQATHIQEVESLVGR